MSAPNGLSFNDGISDLELTEWKVYMLQATTVSTMIAECGFSCYISCLDVEAAYKSIPVNLQQRHLQIFAFMGR